MSKKDIANDPLFAVCDSLIDASLCNTGRHAAHPCTRLVERLHCDAKALSFLTDEVRCRDPAVFQNNIAGVGSTDSHLVLLMAGGETRSPCIDQEHGDSLYAFGLICHRRYTVEGSDAAVCDEALSSV